MNDVSQMLMMGIAATDRGEYAAALQLLNAVYKAAPPEKLPRGLSSYGLCLANVERKHKQGVLLCEQAMKLEFYEGKHWANLVRLYIVGKSRRKAVETLETGLTKLPNDPALLRVRQEIGYRQAPTLRFLSRRNPLNKLFSRVSRKLKGRARNIAVILASLLYVGVVIEVFRLIIH
jgi:tetratricopeptide (TPR) repeat protein